MTENQLGGFDKFPDCLSGTRGGWGGGLYLPISPRHVKVVFIILIITLFSVDPAHVSEGGHQEVLSAGGSQVAAVLGVGVQLPAEA